MTTASAHGGLKVMAEMMKTSLLRPDVEDLLPKLASLQIPSLVIHGRQDIVPYWIAEEIAAAIPNALLVLLDHCGHFPYIEHPKKLFTTIREFLFKQHL